MLDLQKLEGAILFFAVVYVYESTLIAVVRIAVLQLVYHDREVERLVNTGDLSVLKANVQVVDGETQVSHDHALEAAVVGEAGVHFLLLFLSLHLVLELLE